MSPLNEAGITAAFAAIFARLDALTNSLGGVVSSSLATTLAMLGDMNERVAALEANAAPTEAPSSPANAPEVPQGPGNGTERNTGVECEAAPFEASVLDDQMLRYIANDGPKRDGHRVHNDITAIMASELLAARASLGALSAPELADAIRVWRKVEACTVSSDDFVRHPDHTDVGTYAASRLLAWLKDGEA